MAKKKGRKRKVGRPVKKQNKERQIGPSYSVFRDLLYSAKAPGKRISKSGKVYWERRANRSDVNKKQKL